MNSYNLIFLFFLFLTICVTAEDIKRFDTKTMESDDTITLRGGEEFELVLYGNPSTGFRWDVSEISDSSLVAIISDKYEDDFETPKPGENVPLGSKKEHIFTFMTNTIAGTTSIEFEYSRNWEQGTENYFKINVNVIE